MSVLHPMLDKDGFRLRGTSMSRIDGFSDVVFGFALTLLVVSLEVPKTYGELHEMVRGFIPFAISFTFLLMVWFAHYQFFRRFGLHDIWTIVLNAMLLFVVLFYVYPLKFLFTVVVAGMMGSERLATFSNVNQISELMVLYGLGFAAIYILLAALYWNAWRQRFALELTPVEVTMTKLYVLEAAGMGAVGLLSCVVAKVLPPSRAGLAGWVYFAVGVFKTWHGTYSGKKIRQQKERSAAH